MNKYLLSNHRLRRTVLSAALAAFPCIVQAQQDEQLSLRSNQAAPQVGSSNLTNQVSSGSIAGRIATASGNSTIPRVRVELLEKRLSTRTDSQGGYRFENLPAGTYTLQIADEAYDELRQTVQVSAGSIATADVTLNARSSSTQLDKVIVKGMSGAATQRSVPSPISVMTSKDIERQQATNLTDLLRGQLPGMSIMNSGATDWTTLVNARGNTSWNNTGSDLFGDYMKILIDDVEIVRPTLLSMIDPKSISQIEIIRGPLAGAMYGAEGSSGVMRITTKKGRLGQSPEFVVQASAGVIESDSTDKGVTPLVIEKSFQVTGGTELVSYRLGVGQTDVGEWFPDSDSKSRMVSGAVQGSYGAFDISASAIHTDRNLVYGGRNYPMSETLLATTVSYDASPSWHHTLTVGYDKNRFGYEGKTGLGSSKSSDYERSTLRYFTNYNTEFGNGFTGRFTLGADLIRYQSYELEGHSHDDGTDDGHVTAYSWRNFGYYGVAEIGWRDQLYLTLAGRMEQRLRNVSPGEDRPFQPRAGLSYVLGGDNGTIVKLRTQWGTSARAPTGDMFVNTPGRRWSTIAASHIKPEEKVGWDAGVDVTWARVGSFSLTYFNEEGRDLVMPVVIVPGNWVIGRPDLSTTQVSQYQNIGLVTNKGWELEARLLLGPVALRANATVADNRIKALSNYYPPGEDQYIRVGTQRIEIPKHAGGVSATVNAFRGTVSIDGTWIGPRIPRFSTSETPTLWRLNLRTEQEIDKNLMLFGKIDNVLNDQKGERSPDSFMAGRTVVAGVRYTF